MICSCALLELWSEGSAPFEFSQLLAYRSGDMELVAKHLDQLENENLRNLIASMISRIPSDRKSAEVYLDEERGRWVFGSSSIVINKREKKMS